MTVTNDTQYDAYADEELARRAMNAGMRPDMDGDMTLDHIAGWLRRMHGLHICMEPDYEFWGWYVYDLYGNYSAGRAQPPCLLIRCDDDCGEYDTAYAHVIGRCLDLVMDL